MLFRGYLSSSVIVLVSNCTYSFQINPNESMQMHGATTDLKSSQLLSGQSTQGLSFLLLLGYWKLNESIIFDEQFLILLILLEFVKMHQWISEKERRINISWNGLLSVLSSDQGKFQYSGVAFLILLSLLSISPLTFSFKLQLNKFTNLNETSQNYKT